MVSLELPVRVIEALHRRSRRDRRTNTAVVLIALEKELGL